MDTKESKALVKEILEDKGVDYTPYMVNEIISKISTYKNNLIKPAAVLANPDEKKLFASVYNTFIIFIF